MTDKLEIVTVPRDLYYHEVAYVRGLEADNERLLAEFKLILATAPWSDKDGHAECLKIARRALGTKP